MTDAAATHALPRHEKNIIIAILTIIVIPIVIIIIIINNIIIIIIVIVIIIIIVIVIINIIVSIIIAIIIARNPLRVVRLPTPCSQCVLPHSETFGPPKAERHATSSSRGDPRSAAWMGPERLDGGLAPITPAAVLLKSPTGPARRAS